MGVSSLMQLDGIRGERNLREGILQLSLEPRLSRSINLHKKRRDCHAVAQLSEWCRLLQSTRKRIWPSITVCPRLLRSKSSTWSTPE